MTIFAHITFDILPGTAGNIGLITLNRPDALNALDKDMIISLYEQLRVWQDDPQIKAVVIHSASDKAFCAGGDIRQLYDNKQRGEQALHKFFWHEYRLNRLIHNYPKPYIALLDSITMGGGVGISFHGSHPVASENIVFAMPETSIGFFPDVGCSYLLSRCPGQFGLYIGLSGARLKLADLFYTKLIKYAVPGTDHPALIDALVHTDLGDHPGNKVTVVIEQFMQTPPPGELAQYHTCIDTCFAQANIEQILQALQASDHTWGQQTAALLNQKSPTSLKVTLRLLQQAQQFDFDTCIRTEYKLTNRFCASNDFFEGIRALLVDKDKQPRWRPATLDSISENDIARYFAPLTEAELSFDD